MEKYFVNDNVQLCENDTLGRYILADKDFAVGDTIFTDNSLVCVNSFHDIDKKRFDAVEQISKTTGVPLGHIFLLLEYIDQTEKNPQLEEQILLLRDFSKKPAYKDTVELLISKLSLDKTPEQLRTLITVLGIFASNGYRTRSGGAGTCLKMPMIQHSCWPNAGFITVGDEVQIFAISPIKKGENVAISYLRPNMPRAARKKYLNYRYQFVCKCKLCSMPYDALRPAICILCDGGTAYPHKDVWRCLQCNNVIEGPKADELNALETNLKALPKHRRDINKMLKTFTVGHYLVLETLKEKYDILKRRLTIQPELCLDYAQKLLEGSLNTSSPHSQHATDYKRVQAALYDILDEPNKVQEVMSTIITRD